MEGRCFLLCDYILSLTVLLSRLPLSTPREQRESGHQPLLLAGGLLPNCLNRGQICPLPQTAQSPSLQCFESWNPGPWVRLSFSSEIKAWPWGSIRKLLWAVKDPFGHITSCLSLHWTGNQNMERQESRHLVAQEAQPGNRPLRADQSRTIDTWRRHRKLEEQPRQLGSGQMARFHFLIFNFPGL